MEKLNSMKFKALSESQMKSVSGGRWALQSIKGGVGPDGQCFTVRIFEQVILGIKTGNTYSEEDGGLA